MALGVVFHFYFLRIYLDLFLSQAVRDVNEIYPHSLSHSLPPFIL